MYLFVRDNDSASLCDFSVGCVPTVWYFSVGCVPTAWYFAVGFVPTVWYFSVGCVTTVWYFFCWMCYDSVVFFLLDVFRQVCWYTIVI